VAGFFFSRDRLLRFSRFRVACFAIAVLAYLGTEFGRFVYRPYVYRNGIEDFGLADMMGNLGGTVVQIFLYLGLGNTTRIQSLRIVAGITVGYTVYEFLQLVLPRGTFDWLDVWGTIVAGMASVVLLVILHRVLPERSDQAGEPAP